MTLKTEIAALLDEIIALGNELRVATTDVLPIKPERIAVKSPGAAQALIDKLAPLLGLDVPPSAKMT